MDGYKKAYLLFCDEYMRTVMGKNEYTKEDLHQLGLLPEDQESFRFDREIDMIAKAVTEEETLEEINNRHERARRRAYEFRISDNDAVRFVSKSDQGENKEQESQETSSTPEDHTDYSEIAASYLADPPAIITGYRFDADSGTEFRFHYGNECMCTINREAIPGAPIIINGKTHSWKAVVSESILLDQKYYSVIDTKTKKTALCVIEGENSYFIVLIDRRIGGFPDIISAESDDHGRLLVFSHYSSLYRARRWFDGKELEFNRIFSRIALTERISESSRIPDMNEDYGRPCFSIKVYDEWEEFDELMSAIIALPILIDCK